MESETDIVPQRTETVSPPFQESEVPEYNTINKFNSLLSRFGKVTAKTRIRYSGEKEENVYRQRPISLRTTRAELYHDAIKAKKAGDKIKLQNIFAEGRDRDEIAVKYLNQGEVVVNLPNLGENMARYTIITPPESRKAPDYESSPPIVLIPGISNDLDAVGALIQELPYATGRDVIVVGFPASNLGTVTKEFADEVEKTKGFGPHAEFFKQAISSLLKRQDKDTFELWGFSTGAPIAAEILEDPAFQQKVTDAVFLSPASSTNMSSATVRFGIGMEIAKLIRRFGSMGRYTLTQDISEDKEQKRVKKRVFNSLLKRVRTRIDAWKTAKVKEGGSIVVVSGAKDRMTKSDNAHDAFLAENNQMKVLTLPDGSHVTPLTEPAKVLEYISQMKRSTGRTMQKTVFSAH